MKPFPHSNNVLISSLPATDALKEEAFSFGSPRLIESSECEMYAENSEQYAPNLIN